MCSSKQHSLKSFWFLYFFVIHIANSFVANNVRVPRETTANTCLLPSHPKFGQWAAYISTSSVSPGRVAPSGTVLVTSCQSGYKLEGDSTSFCIKGRWTAAIGRCLKKCPPLVSTATLEIICASCNKKEVNCTEAVDGTIAQFKCADFYESSRQLPHSRDHVTCLDGHWSDDIPECIPVCGQKIVKNAPTLIVNGSTTSRNSYPWQVALYNVTDKSLLCGGSLLNQRVILTAAHCVTNDLGKLMSKDFYMVAVGKYYRDFDDPRDVNQTQISLVEDMYVPKQYRGDRQNYLGDIAIIVTNKTFVYSYWVQPVCVDWESKHQNALMNPTKQNRYGYVTGWGYTSENSNPSDVLKQLKVPLIPEEECLQKLPDDNDNYLTYDKLCAGYLNSSSSACKGDSGGGLVFRYKRRYYLVAIVSISPQDTSQIKYGCNSQQYTLYTKISEYTEDFILQVEARIRALITCEQDPGCKDVIPTTPQPSTTEEPLHPQPTQNSCILPQHPNFGRWLIVGGGSRLEPGMSVPSSTVLQLSCSNSHKLVGKELILCLNGNWSSDIGECSNTCPPLVSTSTLTVTCSYKNNELNNCTQPVDGTLAKYKCAPFYEFLTFQRNPVHICINGKWDQAIPTCVPVCGQRKVDAIELIVNGRTALKGSSPWQIAIYTADDKMLICSGSLINPRVVLTAAVCIADEKGRLLPKENYIVAAGKYYRQYNDSRDMHEAQFSSVHEMFIPSLYKAGLLNYLADIALIVTKETFTLSPRIQPVCMDYGRKYSPDPNSYGYVIGWGYTREDANPSDVLKELKVPLVSTQTCSNSLPEDFEVYFTPDKFCAGLLNGSSICRGDSGGSLVVKHDGRYYATGIVSVSPFAPTSFGGCDSHQYALYTKVNDYINDFISVHEAQFRP